MTAQSLKFKSPFHPNAKYWFEGTLDSQNRPSQVMLYQKNKKPLIVDVTWTSPNSAAFDFSGNEDLLPLFNEIQPLRQLLTTNVGNSPNVAGHPLIIGHNSANNCKTTIYTVGTYGGPTATFYLAYAVLNCAADAPVANNAQLLSGSAVLDFINLYIPASGGYESETVTLTSPILMAFVPGTVFYLYSGDPAIYAAATVVGWEF